LRNVAMVRIHAIVGLLLLTVPLFGIQLLPSLPPAPKKLNRVPDPSPELVQELNRLDEKYRNTAPEQFVEMEERAAALAKRYTTQDDQARIWGQLAQVGGQSSIVRHRDFVRKYARKCLELSRDPLERGRMYSMLASAVDVEGFAFPTGRAEAAAILLTGYRELLAQELPETAPELPVVEKVGDVIGNGGIEEAQARARHAAQLAAREEAEFIRSQIGCRDTLVQQLRDLYKPDVNRHGHTSDGPEKLRVLAEKSLTDSQARLLMKRVIAGDVTGKPTEPQPAKIRVQAAGGQKVGEASGFSLAVEVSNPNQKGPLTFIGYKPDSFDPPIPKGQISPIYKVELKRAGKWEKQPQGWCGTGMGAIALEPQATATFGVWVPDGDWEAVKVGVTWTTVAFEKAGEKPGDFTTEWSNELTHKDVQKVK
jgi:hypothetical protein